MCKYVCRYVYMCTGYNVRICNLLQLRTVCICEVRSWFAVVVGASLFSR